MSDNGASELSHEHLRVLEHAVGGRAAAIAERARAAFHRERSGTDEPASNSPPPVSAAARPVRTPTVLQMEAVECGAASLGMVLGYYGRWVPLTELRRACGVSRDGSKAVHIATAARGYGLEVHPRRVPLEELRELSTPSILWWGYNHFVVYEGPDGDGIRVNDPAVGRVSVPRDEVARSFTGIAITFRPTPEFEPGGARHRLVPSLARRAARVRSGLVLAMLAGLLATVPALVTPVITGVFVDDVVGRGERSMALVLVVAIALTAAFRVLTTLLQQRQLLRVQNALAVTSAARFLWHVLRLPLQFFRVRSVSDIALRTDANTTVAQTIAGQLATIGLGVLSAVLFGVVMLFYSWQLAIVLFVLNMVNVVALRSILTRRATANRLLYEDRAKLFATTFGGLRSIETLKATSSESAYFARWAGQQANYVGAENRLAPPTVVLAAVPPVISSLSVAAIVVFGGWQVLNGDMSLGDLVAFQSLSLSFAAPIQQIVNTAGTLQDVGSQLQRLDDALEEPVDPVMERPGSGTGIGGKLDGVLELDGVSFGYSSLDPPLIQDFSMRIEPGRRVALVGPSGAGKSTIVALVSGLLRPWSGSVRLDGRPLEEVPRDVFADSFAVVEQSGELFEGSIRQNLTLWDDTIDEDAVYRGARDAQVHDEITSRPGAYEAMISEGGRNWSGGERQRLELARALARAPRILVLDEATSALDPITEVRVDEAIRRRGISVLTVAHRLSTIRDADEIIVLDKGAVAERGTHDDLLATGGLYARLVGTGGDVGD